VVHSRGGVIARPGSGAIAAGGGEREEVGRANLMEGDVPYDLMQRHLRRIDTATGLLTWLSIAQVGLLVAIPYRLWHP